MIKLYDSALSPFARKVRMVLEHKGLNYEAVDGLLKSNHEALKAANGRIEVPALVDGDVVVEAARTDLRLVYDALDRELARREFVSGPLSIADIALFPHVVSAKAMEVEFSTQAHPNLERWFKQMRKLPICLADLRRAREYVANLSERDIEKRRIFWRGDRIEWVLARGFHAWFFNEIRERRVAWPGPALPAPMESDAAAAG
jgi:glutathione S-transferase